MRMYELDTTRAHKRDPLMATNIIEAAAYWCVHLINAGHRVPAAHAYHTGIPQGTLPMVDQCGATLPPRCYAHLGGVLARAAVSRAKMVDASDSLVHAAVSRLHAVAGTVTIANADKTRVVGWRVEVCRVA